MSPRATLVLVVTTSIFPFDTELDGLPEHELLHISRLHAFHVHLLTIRILQIAPHASGPKFYIKHILDHHNSPSLCKNKSFQLDLAANTLNHTFFIVKVLTRIIIMVSLPPNPTIQTRQVINN